MKSQQTGFTLLELLVVLVILGITMSFAVLSLDLRSDKDIVLEESKRIVTLMRLASEEAIIQGHELALQFDAETYHFLRLDNKNHWQLIEADKVLRERDLAKGIRVELMVEGVAQNEAATSNTIYFYSSGEVSPFQLSLQDNQRKYLYTISADAQGLIQYAEVNDRAS